jgi:hypothetical protein
MYRHRASIQDRDPQRYRDPRIVCVDDFAGWFPRFSDEGPPPESRL